MTATLERSVDPTPAPPDVPPSESTKRHRRRRRPRRWMVVLAALLPIAVVSWSYAGALTYPGSASASVRTVDWLRSHGAAGLVNRIEIWHYSHQEPPRHGTPSGDLPPVPTAAQTARAAAAPADQSPILTPAITPVLPG